MSVSGLAWFIVGGLVGAFLGGIVSYNMVFERNYGERVDYYDLDPIEVKTPTYDQMKEYDAYEFEEF